MVHESYLLSEFVNSLKVEFRPVYLWIPLPGSEQMGQRRFIKRIKFLKEKCTLTPQNLLFKVKKKKIIFFSPEDPLYIIEDSDKLNQFFDPAVIKMCITENTVKLYQLWTLNQKTMLVWIKLSTSINITIKVQSGRKNSWNKVLQNANGKQCILHRTLKQNFFKNVANYVFLKY